MENVTTLLQTAKNSIYGYCYSSAFGLKRQCKNINVTNITVTLLTYGG
jgi:hypothetical protein